MYPDWPQSPADLVPLPRCDGPKLSAFDFHGPQEIEFLEHLGEGGHSHVFKVNILGCVYALKLFRFVYDDDWLGPEANDDEDQDDIKVLSAFYEYSEPFSAECRAYGRLQEAGHEDLAVPCFGYVLLDERHERAVMDKFSDLDLDFNGNGDYPGYYDMRSRFLGRDGRAPPIRGIVKALGRAEEHMRTSDARRILREVVSLQQLGIFHVDVAHRQLIDGKIADFSTAVTTPHFLTNPELNPSLTPEWISAMEFETFRFCLADYWQFDDMVEEWNDEHDDPRDKVKVSALPGTRGRQSTYGLRSTPSRERVYSLVDPRRLGWGASATLSSRRVAGGGTGQKGDGGTGGVSGRAISKPRRRLVARPPRWYYDCDPQTAAKLKTTRGYSLTLSWWAKDGLIFPRKRR
ncbi:hypothetical protein NEMBOFW57_002980 [Staphylotrichum longicolle]|uniref:Protein kinase domain-containing protein n=1 Tax=Staphylotrichum longicolle TaxID=669026 RepID=A0AAD4I459_9PEZI|nr:hypothetical protein NEMBOFW57_002980 [Staphylotrichum longicolle]